ncbi:diamine N-acetyltransferase [Catalinimonas alkaloidigena]|uniref:Diamine N-acetyltransferase n=1 Tax=Catalinimonas alkaloidigena TaxID=1075417 RepID=A0A1G9H918_9BACT|nr:GNAT family N-acetyltransferase [Catalinimonas alkaloidigena]SDL09392.1 diamine N-acetyltransferase [Catalinimonas alkaloidigena]
MSLLLHGTDIALRPATRQDRHPIFEWLAHSDLTPLMLGPPTFPENPAPTWVEFVHDYAASYFDDTAPLQGRCFVIERNGEAIGQINYNAIDPERRATELDIWLAHSRHAGKGYGPDAIQTLCTYLAETFGCRDVYLAPSRRNAGAVRAYAKAGFAETPEAPPWFVPDYPDTVVMVKRLLP